MYHILREKYMYYLVNNLERIKTYACTDDQQQYNQNKRLPLRLPTLKNHPQAQSQSH